jgi:hypothetical protein
MHVQTNDHHQDEEMQSSALESSDKRKPVVYHNFRKSGHIFHLFCAKGFSIAPPSYATLHFLNQCHASKMRFFWRAG